ncbi:ABC transporter substrate-binding protein [Nocardioides jishulii]|uniref:ABC transporter substrate-binding protein n=1 Tax=Nocardioides jishulii TaxID=2575440 RepID=A0A4U2YLZ1_9ACTN|nr:ABC transporter substrate-binding protein [Nocardioides jishulii]QCX27440.1 ABC transporter substrate-binding protein [Nocardioides jishulii]TKI62246.1 ABC transporter substrate-binding protein [Nocardioides jishulii]
MVSKFRRALSVGAAGVLGLTLAACGGGGDSSDDDASTLTVLHHTPYESADPQRIYYGVQLAHYRRLVYRGLLAFPMSEDEQEGTTPVPDLATDTGTSSQGGKVWKFTLKEGVKWEDGSDITCEDVKYGTSRVFANDVITGGPNYTLSYLDIPTDKDGAPVYKGPYSGKGQEFFDKAVTCDDRTVTFRFNKPWADFPLAIAGMMMADPYKKEFDEGAKSQWKILSNGPYKVEGGTWSKNKGATLVRNEEYDPSTDEPDLLRKALPDRIEMVVDPSDTAGELFNDRLIKNSPKDQRAITIARVAPNQFPKIKGDVAERYVNTLSPYTSYLSPNFKRLTDVNVRRALAVALDSEGYVTALGGERAAETSENIINPTVPGWSELDAFKGDNAGDPAAAKKLLQEAGVKTPFSITLGYMASPTNDKAMAVVKESWDAAGFKTRLEPLGDTYYDVISKPDDEYDITWAGWGADWPSAMTVLPALFDSRPNFSPTTCGQDYGCYQSKEFETLVDKAANAADLDSQVAALQESNELLARDVAYIPLDVTKFNWLYGSKVTGFTTTPASSSYPEIGLIGVED